MLERSVVGAALALSVLGCADAPARDAIIPASAAVPDGYADAALEAGVAAADGLSGLLHRTSGFAEGRSAKYWPFPVVASAATMPGYQLCQPTGAVCTPIAGHPLVVDAVPGDASYAPFVRVSRVPVTTRYAGERFPSFRAIAQGQGAGLLGAPVDTHRFAHVYVVGADVSLEVGSASSSAEVPLAPTDAYYRGVRVRAFDFSAVDGLLSLDGDAVLVRNVYSLTRQGESQPLSESARATDLTGDGDQLDSNNLLGTDVGLADYTPLWRLVTVTVPTGYASIDTSMDETIADATSPADLFTIDSLYQITPIAGAVVDHTLTTTLIDCPIQHAVGGL